MREKWNEIIVMRARTHQNAMIFPLRYVIDAWLIYLLFTFIIDCAEEEEEEENRKKCRILLCPCVYNTFITHTYIFPDSNQLWIIFIWIIQMYIVGKQFLSKHFQFHQKKFCVLFATHTRRNICYTKILQWAIYNWILDCIHRLCVYVCVCEISL